MFSRKIDFAIAVFLLSVLFYLNSVEAKTDNDIFKTKKHEVNEPSRLNVRLQRHINIPQSCKKELKEYCPKELYSTRQSRFECLSKKIDIFSSRCKYYVVRSKNFYEKCSKDIAVFCNKTNGVSGNVAVYEKNCSETLMRKYKQLSAECANYIIGYSGHNISTKTAVRNIMKNGKVEDVARSAIYEQKKHKSSIKRNKQNAKSDKIVNDGNYTAQDIKNMNTKVVLSNGIMTNQYEVEQFEKKYHDILKDMDEKEYFQFENRYFELKQADK